MTDLAATIKRIADGLRDRRIDIVARETGLSRTTIIKMRDGKNGNPTIQVVDKLSRYLGMGERANG